jgi:hypothetical protein
MSALLVLAIATGALLLLVVTTMAALAWRRNVVHRYDLALAELLFDETPSDATARFARRRKGLSRLIQSRRGALERFAESAISFNEIRASYFDDLARSGRRVHAALYLLTFGLRNEDIDERSSEVREAAEWYRDQIRHLHPAYLRTSPLLLDLVIEFAGVCRLAERAGAIAPQHSPLGPDDRS